jgi:uncharacterized phage-like protein YoqJ
VIIAGTGHRQVSLGIGYSDKAFLRLAAFAGTVLRRLRPDEVISGMALGWDQALAQAATEIGIPFKAYVPFMGQESLWPKASQNRYNSILSKAKSMVVRVNSSSLSIAGRMQARNEMMVNDADYVLALWNGSAGGTKNTVDYAASRDKKVINVWPEWEQFNVDPISR